MSIVNTFSLQSNRQIKINFDWGDLSSDAGLLLIKEFVSKLGIERLLNHLFKTNDPVFKAVLTGWIFLSYISENKHLQSSQTIHYQDKIWIIMQLPVCRADNLSFYQCKIITINNAGAGFWYPVPALLIPQGLGGVDTKYIINFHFQKVC